MLRSSPRLLRLLYLYRYFRKRRVHLLDDLLNFVHPRTLSSLFSYQPKSEYTIYFINLDHRKDRLGSITAQFDRLGLSARRFEAIQLKNRGHLEEQFPHLSNRPVSDFLMSDQTNALGHLGCFLSHYEVIKNLPEDDGHSLICEDDLLIYSSAFLKWIDHYISNPFDILLLDPQGCYRKEDRIERNLYRISTAWPHYWGLHAYLVRHRSKQKIIDYLGGSGKLDAIDLMLCSASAQLQILGLRTSLSRPGGKFGSDLA